MRKGSGCQEAKVISVVHLTVHIVDRLINPVTRSVVILSPPAECTDDEDFTDLLAEFELYCENAWAETPQRDPAEINPGVLRGWE